MELRIMAIGMTLLSFVAASGLMLRILWFGMAGWASELPLYIFLLFIHPLCVGAVVCAWSQGNRRFYVRVFAANIALLVGFWLCFLFLLK